MDARTEILTTEVHRLTRRTFWLAALTGGALASASSQAQIFKCTDDSGRVEYSDQPCASLQKSESVVIRPATVTPEESREMAVEREEERSRNRDERNRAEREEQDQRITDARAEVRKIKSDNYDPQKCSSARSKMAAMKRRDPIAYKTDVSYFEYQQMAELYCGS